MKESERGIENVLTLSQACFNALTLIYMNDFIAQFFIVHTALLPFSGSKLALAYSSYLLCFMSFV